jgi:hypothetical protein
MTAPDRSETLRLHHRVEAIDGATGEPLDRVAASLPPGEWPHWVLKTQGGDILLSAYDRMSGELPGTTTVELRIDDPEVAMRYANGDAPVAVELQKGVESPADPVKLAPKDTGLEVRLRVANGDPSEGHTVSARYTGPQNPADTDDAADEVTLHEGPPGLYSCPPRAWRPHPYSLVIAGQLVRPFLIDHMQSVTRLQFKYP